MNISAGFGRLNDGGDDTRLGYVLIILSSFFFAIMGLFVKATAYLPLFERVFFRNLVMFGIISLLMYKTGTSYTGKVPHRKFLIARSLLGFLGVSLFFYAMSNITLADATALNRLSPFFAALAASVLLRERLTRLHVGAMFVLFGSVLLIIKPGFNPDILPALAGLGSAVVAGFAYATVRHLHDKEHPFTIIFYFCTISTVISFPLMMMDFQMPNFRDMLLLFCIGACASGGQFFLTLGLRYGEASKVTPLNNMHVVFVLILAFMVFGEVPDILSSLGILMILLTALVLFWKTRKD